MGTDPVVESVPWGRRLIRWITPWTLEAVLMIGIIVLYQLTKLRAVVAPEVGLQHGRDIIALEQKLGIFIEPSIHRAIADDTSLMPVLRWLYLNLHFPVTLGFLIWLRYWHPSRYPRIRNGFALAHLIALVVFVLYPCAPPRMFPSWGFSEVLHLPYEGQHNPMAVIPSMHFGYASLVGGGWFLLGKSPWVRALGLLYAALCLFVIVATAAHFLIDAPLGTLTIAVGLFACGAFKRTLVGDNLKALA